MNKEEKLSLYRANCNACLLAEKMKDCPLCRFVQPEKLKDTVPIQKKEGK